MAKIERAGVRRRADRPTHTTRPGKQATDSKSPPASLLESVTGPGEITHLRGVLFGPPKTGKTVAACSGSGKKLLMLTEPDGDLSVRGVKDLDVVRPTTYDEMSDVLTDLATVYAGRWDTLIFDSVSMAQQSIGGKPLAKVLKEERDPRPVYQRFGAAINQLIYDAVRLPMHTLFTAQLRVDDGDPDGEPLDPEIGEYKLSLAVTPMILKTLTPAVSFLGRTYKRKVYDERGNATAEYWVSLDDQGQSPAGSRIPLPAQVQDLTLDKLLAALSEEGG